MASRCGHFFCHNVCLLFSMIFPLMVSRLPLFVCGSEPMSVPLSSGKGHQTIRAMSRPNLLRERSPPIKSSCFAAYFIGVEPCLIPSSSALCCPRNETGIFRALNAKNRLDRRLCCGVESHRRFGRIDRHLDAVCLRVSYSSNAPNRLPPSVLPYSMALHRRCIGLDCLPTVVLRRYKSNDGERLPPPRHFS